MAEPEMTEAVVPVFPLNAVIFPEGRMKLRIFEPRYVDMLSYCMQVGSGFGVCPIEKGNEAGTPAEIFSVGTTVDIVDFEQLEGHLLGITVEGRSRFEVCESWVNDSQLRMAEVAYLPPVIQGPISLEYENLVLLLRQVFPQIQAEYGYQHTEYDNGSWVLARLVELLPLPISLKASLLEDDDPIAGLQVVNQIITSDKLS